MANITPFESAGNKLPAFLRAKEGAVGNLAAIAAAAAGFPSLSIKGKVFHLKRGDEKTLITKPDAPDEPAAALEVVILAIGPEGAAYAKTFYATGYTEGSDAKPTCYSDDGITPAADSEEVQAKKCAACPHNQFGSRISESGGKGKACADTKRLAVAQATAINDPMLLRIPPASLKSFREYAKLLASRGITESQAVVTKVGFDYSVAHPALTFKPVGFVDEQTYFAALEESRADTVKAIIGDRTFVAPTPPDEEFEAQPAAAAEAKVAPAKPKAEAKPKVEDAPKAEAKPAAKPQIKVEPASDIESAADDLLGDVDLDFDD